MRTIFLTALGTQAYEEARYTYNGKEWKSRFAPVATAALVFTDEERAQLSVRVLCTPTARERRFDALAHELTDLGIQDIKVHEVPETKTPADFEHVLKAILDAIAGFAAVAGGDRAAVAIDLTLGLRHLPVLYLAALAYAAALHDVQVRGLYYGAFELRGADSTCPLIDIGIFFELLQWYQALAALRDTGRAQPLAKALRLHVKALFTRQATSSVAPRLVSLVKDAAEQLAPALACGLPLEAGIAAGHLLRAMENVETHTNAALLAAQRLMDVVRRWALHPAPQSKANILLDDNELRRQWHFIAWLHDHDDYGNCLEALREWVVNLVLWRQGEQQHWLDYKGRRKQAEKFLQALSWRKEVVGGEHLSSAQQELARVWQQIAVWRNILAHAGMKPDEPPLARDKTQALLQAASKLLELAPQLEARFPGQGRLLIASLGRSPGALYSAIYRVDPDALLVLTSREAVARLDETLRVAGAAEVSRAVEILDDPYRAFQQAAPLVERHREYLLQAAEVIVNLTGGTTAMQYLCERLADAASRLGVPVRRMAVTDERPYAEQQADPFRAGCIEWLDGDNPTTTADAVTATERGG